MSTNVVSPRIRIPEAAAILRVSRTHIYDLLSDGTLTVVKDGRSTFLLREQVLEYAMKGSSSELGNA